MAYPAISSINSEKTLVLRPLVIKFPNTGAAEKIKARIEAMDEIFDCHAVRVRYSGPYCFVDLHVTLDGQLPLHVAHDLTERVEKVVQEVLPDADVTVHPEPRPPSPSEPGGR